MKTTDYSAIAARYDNNKIRHQIERDNIIEQLLAGNPTGFAVHDLACGTGIYL